MQVSASRLDRLYATSNDPWNTAASDYEQEKFGSTKAALARSEYDTVFEVGCGNGQLARHLAPLCDTYIGMDAVEKALTAARHAVPSGRFIQGYYPCPLPPGNYDLIILSEFLYFLGSREVGLLGREIVTHWPTAEVICVTYLGQTGHVLQGEDALWEFMAAVSDTHAVEMLRRTEHYRIDRGLPVGSS